MQLNNRTIFCHDNLEVLQGIDSNSIDLIYLDPPFNKQKMFTAPVGSSAEGAKFKDWFREDDIKDEWVQSIKEDYDGLHKFLRNVKELSSLGAQEGTKHYLYNYCYLVYIAMRLLEMQRILKETGSIYLHCDPTMGHFLKILLDIIFGEKNFRNEIIWRRTLGHHLSNSMDNATDHIFSYSKSDDNLYNQQYNSLTKTEVDKKFPYIEEETGRRYTHEKLEQSSNSYSKGEKRIIQGKEVTSDLGWRWTQKTFNKRLKENPNCIFWTSNNRPRYKRYLDEYKGRKVDNLWVDLKPMASQSKERTGYPTQKPLALLERIIKASSNEGDLILDPFCGCATTCIAAEKLNRKWIGIDVSVKAYELVKERLRKEVANPENLFQYDNQINFSVSPPRRTDKNLEAVEKKYVYVISNPKYPGEYKVGIAKNDKRRISNYQTSDPDRSYKLEYSLHTPLFRAIEKHIHTKFENKHEWVRANLEDLIFEIENYSNRT